MDIYSNLFPTACSVHVKCTFVQVIIMCQGFYSLLPCQVQPNAPLGKTETVTDYLYNVSDMPSVCMECQAGEYKVRKDKFSLIISLGLLHVQGYRTPYMTPRLQGIMQRTKFDVYSQSFSTACSIHVNFIICDNDQLPDRPKEGLMQKTDI